MLYILYRLLMTKHDVSEAHYVFIMRKKNETYCHKQTSNSVAFSSQANYADGETAAGRRILLPTFGNKRVLRGQGGGPHGR
jgi:hypothetical protein